MELSDDSKLSDQPRRRLGVSEAAKLRRQRIRENLYLLYRPAEIRQQLNIPRTTFARDMAAITKEDQKWLDEQAKGALVSAIRNAIDILQEQQREAEKLSLNQEVSPEARLKAFELIKEIELDKVDVLTSVPTLWNYSLKNRLQNRMKAREFESTV
ncbi:MAG: hypothetical protein HYY67_01820 [Thaumarchaeota archaeon]|nr:hypothetical protein [Nitrososphaerota archaeon]